MEFNEYAAQADHRMSLLAGALLVARDAHPAPDLAEQAARIDELASPLLRLDLGAFSPGVQAAAIAEHLYGVCGFQGNASDYYDPRNSFLNDVLDRRLGIPISLAIVYVEVARRCGVTAHGVSFPGHFLVRVEQKSERPLLVDPFHGGAILDRENLERVLRSATGSERDLDDSMLRPATVREILVRMLGNLRAIYASRGQHSRLLVVIDRIVELVPDAVAELRDRGLLSAQLGAPRAAIDDLMRYLRLAPTAGDVAEVRRLIDRLETAAVRAPN